MSKLGFRCSQEARLVRDAVSRGWLMLPRNGRNHTRLHWPPTGYTTQIPGKLDDGMMRLILRRLERIEKDQAVPTSSRFASNQKL